MISTQICCGAIYTSGASKKGEPMVELYAGRLHTEKFKSLKLDSESQIGSLKFDIQFEIQYEIKNSS